MDRDDIIQSVLITFCKKRRLTYSTVSPTGDDRTFAGIQWVLRGPYCLLYNYFTLYTFMTQRTDTRMYNAFVRPYNEEH
eukprot:1739984-Pleurochrysis_carterae.AAC.1